VNTNWQVSPGLNLSGNFGTREGASFNTALTLNSSKHATTSMNATVNDRNGLRWNVGQSIGDLKGSIQSSELGTSSNFSYRLPVFPIDSNADITANYQLNYQPNASKLGTIMGRYSSPAQNRQGKSIWEGEFGYGWSILGNGLLASVEVRFLDGINFRSRYQGVSINGRENIYSAEIITTIDGSGN
jgi:hypothetical protein